MAVVGIVGSGEVCVGSSRRIPGGGVCYEEKSCRSLSSSKDRSPERAHCVVEREGFGGRAPEQGYLRAEGFGDGASGDRDLGCLYSCAGSSARRRVTWYNVVWCHR